MSTAFYIEVVFAVGIAFGCGRGQTLINFKQVGRDEHTWLHLMRPAGLSCFFTLSSLDVSLLLNDIYRCFSTFAKDLKIKICITIITPVVLYGCEIWSLIHRGMQAKCISEEVLEASTWAQVG